jgi:hypothetical protein
MIGQLFTELIDNRLRYDNFIQFHMFSHLSERLSFGLLNAFKIWIFILKHF